jgi:hypothetical protein
MIIQSKVKKQKGESHSLILPEEIIIKEAYEVEGVKEEEALVEEEDLSYVIIAINLDI